MTAPSNGQPSPVVDAGNPFLGPDHPANLTLGKLTGPQGDRIILTIRQAGATLTVLLNQHDAKTWAAQLDRAASNASRLIVPNGIRIGIPPGAPPGQPGPGAQPGAPP